MRKYLILFLAVSVLFLSPALSLAKERPLPSFKITGYIEKINADSILVYVPRMKQSIVLFLAKNVLVTDFANPDSKNQYTIKNLKEKDMAIFEGIINQVGFVCQVIAFVRSF